VGRDPPQWQPPFLKSTTQFFYAIGTILGGDGILLSHPFKFG
jgi:hypothetical protein